jgi:glutathione S-transferase
LERVQIYYSHLRKYDIAKGRPNLEKFNEEMNKIEAYTQTKKDPLFLLDLAKNHLKVRYYSESMVSFFLLLFYLPIGTNKLAVTFPDCLKT